MVFLQKWQYAFNILAIYTNRLNFGIGLQWAIS
jgi:hypothetical protein